MHAHFLQHTAFTSKAQFANYCILKMGDSVAEKLELVENVSDVAPENRNVLDGFIRENAAMTLKPSMFQTTNEV